MTARAATFGGPPRVQLEPHPAPHVPVPSQSTER
jgi:hypothetical protein